MALCCAAYWWRGVRFGRHRRMMKYTRNLKLAAVLVIVVFSGMGLAQGVAAMDAITIWGERGDPELITRVDPATMPVSAPDTADMLKSIPGANVVSNGPIAGQAQYRGMFGPRLNIQLDGMYVNSGGPNWMDPPLHYMPAPILDSFEVLRGIAPVSLGTSIGGAIDAKAKTSTFTDGDAAELQADIVASGRDVSDSYAFGGLLGIANNQFRFHVIGSAEEGDDIDFKGGKIRPGEFKRNVYGVGGAMRLGGHELGLDFRNHKTTDAGNPSLPMDTILIENDLLNFQYEGDWGGVAVEAQIYYSDIDHAMDNFSLRAAPGNPMMFRLVETVADGLGFELKGTVDALAGQITIGADGHWAEHSMDIFNPNNALFFVDNFNKAEQNRLGGFVEWRGNIAGSLSGELGVRYSHVTMDAGDVSVGPVLPPPAVMLKDAFNAADHSKNDHNIDVVAQLNYDLNADVTLRLAAARKTRSPSYIERFAWLPIEASAGLADGNNYIGDVNLDPEVSYEVEAGFDWENDRVYLLPRVFYRHVDDYIQGTPVDATPGVIDSPLEMVSAVNGDSTPLRYTNVAAKIYGFDTAWGIKVMDHLRLDGIVTYVRGKRRDINDDLYRITPLRATAALSYVRQKWSVTLEGVGVASQKKISLTNGEFSSAGHRLMNLNGMVKVMEQVKFVAGVDNVFDNLYREHLSGFNRASSSDVPVGIRLPGAGRNFFGRISFVL